MVTDIRSLRLEMGTVSSILLEEQSVHIHNYLQESLAESHAGVSMRFWLERRIRVINFHGQEHGGSFQGVIDLLRRCCSRLLFRDATCCSTSDQSSFHRLMLAVNPSSSTGIYPMA